MILFDTTKTGSASHRSGLTRVSARLRELLASAATDVVWSAGELKTVSSRPYSPTRDNWFFTSELFSEEERPGFTEFLARRRCRAAALFHDAIPLKHPHITWPQSVARHPAYMKSLAYFDRVWAVSGASRDELLGFWKWQGNEPVPPVDVLELGADFDATPRIGSPVAAAKPPSPARPSLLCVGIIEPRKNQLFLLEVCEELWRDGLLFELHLVGRVNPHFGSPTRERIKFLQRTRGPLLQFHESAEDSVLAQLYAHARATVFPTIAEGCGLPLLESLWRGVPCLHSDLPVLRENAAAGGCVAVATNEHAAWTKAVRDILLDDALHDRLRHAATTRVLPTWGAAAETLRRAMTLA